MADVFCPTVTCNVVTDWLRADTLLAVVVCDCCNAERLPLTVAICVLIVCVSALSAFALAVTSCLIAAAFWPTAAVTVVIWLASDVSAVCRSVFSCVMAAPRFCASAISPSIRFWSISVMRSPNCLNSVDSITDAWRSSMIRPIVAADSGASLFDACLATS